MPDSPDTPKAPVTRQTLRDLLAAKDAAEQRRHDANAYRQMPGLDIEQRLDAEVAYQSASVAAGKAINAFNAAAAAFQDAMAPCPVLSGDQPKADRALLGDFGDALPLDPEPFCEATGPLSPLDTPGSGFYIGRAKGDGGRSIEAYLNGHNNAGTTDGC